MVAGTRGCFVILIKFALSWHAVGNQLSARERRTGPMDQGITAGGAVRVVVG